MKGGIAMKAKYSKMFVPGSEVWAKTEGLEKGIIKAIVQAVNSHDEFSYQVATASEMWFLSEREVFATEKEGLEYSLELIRKGSDNK